MARTILVVDEAAAAVADLVAALRQAGYTATGTHTFRDASKILSTTEPSALIANVRLGAYNGLHLLLRGQADHPAMRGIIIGPADATTEREALGLGASVYLPHPVAAEHVLAEVAKLPLPAPRDVWRTTEAPPSAVTFVSTATLA